MELSAKLASRSLDPDGMEARRRAMAAAQKATAKFIHGLQKQPGKERTEAALELARYCQNAFGLEAAALGAELRRSGALAFVLSLMYEDDSTHQCVCLMILGNLVCEAFDPRASETAKLVLRAEAFPRLKALLFSTDSMIVTHVCGCLQNLSAHGIFAKVGERERERAQALELWQACVRGGDSIIRHAGSCSYL